MRQGMHHNSQSIIPTSSRSRFDETVYSDFLKSGWVLSLDAQQILVGWGQWHKSSQPAVSPGSCALYTPDYYLENPLPWRQTENWDLLGRTDFGQAVASQAHSNTQRFQWVEPAAEDFEKSWQCIQTGFQSRELLKAVPVVFSQSTSEVRAEQIQKMLKSLTAQPRQTLPYGFWSEGEGVMGGTPETLFSVKADGAVETMALAGTCAKNDAASVEFFLRDPKERYEHQLVVDDLKERLSRIGDVAIGSTGILELPTLYHLITRIQSRPSKQISFTDFVQLLHPTPALGVSPRALGFSEIKLWDRAERRGRFGAPFGASFDLGDGRHLGHCLVAIRNIQWQHDQIRLGAGCGVVAESRFDKEWQELRLKRDAVKRVLGL